MSDGERQEPNRGRERADAAEVGSDAAGNNSDGNGPRVRAAHLRQRRSRVRSPPPPVWLRRDEEDADGPLEQVERTPLNVIIWDLDDPFPDIQEDDEDESSASDDGNNVVELSKPLDPGMAAVYLVELMSKYRRYRLRELTVSLGDNVRTGDPIEIPVERPVDLAADFPQFVTELRDYHRIRGLYLTRGNFGSENPEVGGAGEDARGGGGGGDVPGDETQAWGRDLSLLVGDDCLKEFFGPVLSNHRSLEHITFSNSRIPTKYWRLFTETLVTDRFPLIQLTLESTPLTAEDCQLLKAMLERKSQILHMLALIDCGLGAEEWRAVCEGVAGTNGEMNFVMLEEADITVQPDTLVSLLRPPSAVEFLSVSAPTWADGAFEELVRELRTNECMFEFVLENYPDFAGLPLVEELLTTYNCTLKEITLDAIDEASQNRINDLLARNARVRNRGTPEPDSHTWVPKVKKDPASVFERYHFSSQSVWPRALQEYGRIPTLLYRFVRRGNLEDFAGQVEAGAAATAATASAASAAAAMERPREVKKKRRTTARPRKTKDSRSKRRLYLGPHHF